MKFPLDRINNLPQSSNVTTTTTRHTKNMNIEEAIIQLTAAMRENTAAVREILAVATSNVASTAVPTEEKPAKVKKVKAEKIAVLPDPEPVEEPTPEPVEVPTPEPTAEPTKELSHDEKLAALKETVKGKFFENEGNRVKFSDLREKYKVENIKGLTAENIDAFIAEVESW